MELMLAGSWKRCLLYKNTGKNMLFCMHSVQSAETVQMPNLWCNVNTHSPNKKKKTNVQHQHYPTAPVTIYLLLTTHLEATGHALCCTTMLAPSSAHLSQTFKQKSVPVSVSSAEEPTSRAKRRYRELRHKNRLTCQACLKKTCLRYTVLKQTETHRKKTALSSAPNRHVASTQEIRGQWIKQHPYFLAGQAVIRKQTQAAASFDRLLCFIYWGSVCLLQGSDALLKMTILTSFGTVYVQSTMVLHTEKCTFCFECTQKNYAHALCVKCGTVTYATQL